MSENCIVAGDADGRPADSRFLLHNREAKPWLVTSLVGGGLAAAEEGRDLVEHDAREVQHQRVGARLVGLPQFEAEGEDQHRDVTIKLAASSTTSGEDERVGHRMVVTVAVQ